MFQVSTTGQSLGLNVGSNSISGLVGDSLQRPECFKILSLNLGGATTKVEHK